MKKQFDYNLESLRGFCALIVLFHHIVIFRDHLDPVSIPGHILIPYDPPGRLMVLIFFMLSGYVIGLVYSDKKDFSITDYIKKRLIRLYPIYIFSILITVLFFSESLKVVIANLFFTQNILSVTIPFNQSLWSLNHEMVYYILVIPILKFNISTKKVFPILIGLLLLSLFLFGFPMIIEGYLVGFIFWLSGFSLSKIKKAQVGNLPQLGVNKMLSVFFLAMAWDYLNPFVRVFNWIHVIHGTHFYQYDDNVAFNDVFSYFICAYAIVVFSSINIKGLKLYSWLLYAGCFFRLIIVILNGSFFKVGLFYVPAIFLLLSFGLFFLQKGIFKSMSFLGYLGSISYAFYVIHTPLLYAIGKIPFFSGSISSYIARSCFLFLIVFILAYLLEKKLQPAVKKLLYKKTSPA